MMTKREITAMCCNIISAMVCYMNNEFTKEQLVKDVTISTHNNKDVIEHLELLVRTNP